MVQFVMLYKVVLTLVKPWCVTIQLKATEQYFHVVQFIMLYQVVLTFTSAVPGGSNFYVCG